jgi:hypothetical protein
MVETQHNQNIAAWLADAYAKRTALAHEMTTSANNDQEKPQQEAWKADEMRPELNSQVSNLLSQITKNAHEHQFHSQLLEATAKNVDECLKSGTNCHAELTALKLHNEEFVSSVQCDIDGIKGIGTDILKIHTKIEQQTNHLNDNKHTLTQLLNQEKTIALDEKNKTLRIHEHRNSTLKQVLSSYGLLGLETPAALKQAKIDAKNKLVEHKNSFPKP